MQFNHEMLYKSLRDIIIMLKKAIGEHDIKTVVRLTKEHESIMNDLKQAGLSNDPQMLSMIKKIKEEIDEFIVEIERKRDETGRELKRIGNGKKLVDAYGW